jgi:hypothetical protein
VFDIRASCLVEVKSAGRNASEKLTDLLHLKTWAMLRHEVPVGGGVLIVNHQYDRPADQRSASVRSHNLRGVPGPSGDSTANPAAVHMVARG